MKRNEKIRATWLSLMSIMSQTRFATKVIELFDSNYNSIASISCTPNDDDGIGEIDFSKWLLEHFHKMTNDCEIDMLLVNYYNLTARISGMSSDGHEINSSKWLLSHTDTATNELELADIFARTRHILANDIDDNTLWWRHSVIGFCCGSRYIERIKCYESGEFVITNRYRISKI